MQNLQNNIGVEECARIRQAEAILSIITRHGNNQAGDLHPAHRQKILGALRRNDRLDILLPAFPAKSANRKKTLGPLPDMGEVLALKRLQSIAEEISEIHAPGARILICSDGSVFSDLVLVAEEDVDAYRRSLDALIEEFCLDRLATLHLEDLFPGAELNEMRKILVKQYGRSVADIREGVLSCKNEEALLNGIHRFLFEDQLALISGKSRNRIREESRALAYQVVQRSHSWGALVESLFPNALRLSIHPQAALSLKLGIRLVECENRWSTPWHNVVIEENGQFKLAKREEAEIRGELVFFRGKFPYFRSKNENLA